MNLKLSFVDWSLDAIPGYFFGALLFEVCPQKDSSFEGVRIQPLQRNAKPAQRT
ncbi:MAG: hypothetical protein RR431_11475 [Clostridia bacterium]